MMCPARTSTCDHAGGEDNGSNKNNNNDDDDAVPTTDGVSPGLPWPEDTDAKLSWLCRAYQRWTYSYMGPILKKGSQQTEENRLKQEDLYRVPASMESKFLAEKFHRLYYDNEQKSDRTENNDDDGNDASKLAKDQRRLMRTLWHIGAPTFIPAGFCELLTVLCQIALPLLVRQLLRMLEGNPDSQIIVQGLPWAFAIFACTFLNAFGNHRHRHLALKSGIAIRAATVTILYQHVLRLSHKGKRGLTTGLVTNLIATDTQKLFEVCQDGHLVWALPLSMVLVTICLLLVLGPTSLVGILVLILFVPLVERVTSTMLAIRTKRVKMTDRRVGIISSMLEGIKVTKLNSYEKNYEKRITEARNKELSYLRKELAVWAMTLVLTVISPIVATAATFTVYVLVDENNVLTASRSFSVLLLFSALRFPINFAGRLIGKATQAFSAMQRISLFLSRELRSIKAIENDGCPPSSTPLIVSNASFYTDALKQGSNERSSRNIVSSFSVSKFDFFVERGQVVAVCGPVGGGKSSLINGLISEMTSTPDSNVHVTGKIALVSQDAFILNDTFRENILFGREFNRVLYERVLESCCLRHDIEQFGDARDNAVIGERGITLSGGQKQRVSLARAAYSQADVVLLDDPLSALDAETSMFIFDQLICGKNALLENAAVVLVTHASYLLNRVDKIILIVDGVNRFTGCYDDLIALLPDDEKTKSFLAFLKNSIQEGSCDSEVEEASAFKLFKWLDGNEGDQLMTIEEREHGLSSPRTWLLWFKRAGGAFFLSFQLLFMAVDRFAYVAVEYWLARWTSGAREPIECFGITFPSQAEGRFAQYKYLAVYFMLIVVSVLSTIVRSEWSVTGGRAAAKKVFSTMLERILRAPISYFERTPIGRVLNRFTYDTEVIDVTLTQTMSMFMISCSWYIAGICVMIAIIPYTVAAILPVSATYWLLLLHYRNSGSDLQRLDAVSRSPMQAQVSEGLDGATTIRLFNQQETFIYRFQAVVNMNSSALLNFVSAQRWLGFRIEILGSIVVLCCSLLVITLNDQLQLNAGIIGLLILWSSNFTITLGFLVDTFADTEAAITAIERVDAMAGLPQEIVGTSFLSVDDVWPKHGHLVFENVCLRYRSNLPLALNDLSFQISAGTKCGIVGRTWAGKSSLTVALFRLVELESGTIKLDGNDLAKISLEDVRGRPGGMSIIPQDPFLAGETLRTCVDPFDQYGDEDILEALKAVRIATESDSSSVLDLEVEAGGSNFSIGERQLLNLARALLSRPKVLVLDESTASLDGETDAFIQQMLRTRFANTTLITIAHRLESVMDYDQIIVMNFGRASETGSPAELLSKRGLFADLIDSAGPRRSSLLRTMVKQA